MTNQKLNKRGGSSPPIDEQDEIVKAIDIGLQKLSDQESVNTRQINNLTEYRSALITATVTVTGQIDVRDRQPPDSATV